MGENTSEPNIRTFLTLCKILHIPDIYEEFFGINPANPLTRLNESGKDKTLEYIDLLLASGKYEKDMAKIIAFPKRELRLFTTMVSAGTSNFLDGEIGIFCLNGDAFCKKLQDDEDGLFLISLNTKYPPMQVGENDTLKIFGKVVG